MANDMIIIYSIMVFFIILGGLLPFVQDAFGQSQTTDQTKPFIDDLTHKATRISTTNAFSILLSVIKMFFWTFGTLPFIIDLVIFIPLRIILVATIARNIWIGGGG
jgi:hypothetical protein